MSSKNESYYDAGSSTVAELTAVTSMRLERRRQLTTPSDRLVICLVGLPGRGKSFIARKLQTFLTWRGNACRVFNVGKYRRQAQADYNMSLLDQQQSQNDDENNDGMRASVRQKLGACDANFFDSNNPEAREVRQRSAQAAMDDMLLWLDNDEFANEKTYARQQSGMKATIRRSRIAIFDATNSTVERRKWVLEECTDPVKRHGKTTGCIFVESICDDKELLEENFRFKVDNSPDFKSMTRDEALDDLRMRVQKYEEQYETIKEDDQSYIKIFNLSSKMLVNHIYGRMAKVIVPCLMSWNIGNRPIYLCRAGQTKVSDDDSEHEGSPKRLPRGDTLGERGQVFRQNLEKFMESEGIEFTTKRKSALKAKDMKAAFRPTNSATGTSVSGIASSSSFMDLKSLNKDDDKKKAQISCHVMTSTMPRSVETATWDNLPFIINEMPNLNPLDKGDFTGMELDEIREKDPAWYEMLEEDPFLTRFPGGECYGDLIHRLETCIIDMEQQVNMVCVVSHVSVLQVLISYFRKAPIQNCTSIQVPMHTVFKFTPVTGGGWNESLHRVSPLDDMVENDLKLSTISDEEKTNTPIWGDRLSKGTKVFQEGSNLFCCTLPP